MSKSEYSWSEAKFHRSKVKIHLLSCDHTSDCGWRWEVLIYAPRTFIRLKNQVQCRVQYFSEGRGTTTFWHIAKGSFPKWQGMPKQCGETFRIHRWAQEDFFIILKCRPHTDGHMHLVALAFPPHIGKTRPWRISRGSLQWWDKILGRWVVNVLEASPVIETQ